VPKAGRPQAVKSQRARQGRDAKVFRKGTVFLEKGSWGLDVKWGKDKDSDAQQETAASVTITGATLAPCDKKKPKRARVGTAKKEAKESSSKTGARFRQFATSSIFIGVGLLHDRKKKRR